MQQTHPGFLQANEILGSLTLYRVLSRVAAAAFFGEMRAPGRRNPSPVSQTPSVFLPCMPKVLPARNGIHKSCLFFSSFLLPSTPLVMRFISPGCHLKIVTENFTPACTRPSALFDTAWSLVCPTLPVMHPLPSAGSKINASLAVLSVRILSLVPEAPCFYSVLHRFTCLAYTFSNMLFESGTVQSPFIVMGISLKVLKPSHAFSASVNMNRSAPGPRRGPKPEDPGLKMHDQDPESRAALGIWTQD